MKANESLLHKALRTVVQNSLRKEVRDPCSTFWTYQPLRPNTPLTQQEKK